MKVQCRVISRSALPVALVSLVVALAPAAKSDTLVGWYQFDDPSDPWRDSSGNQKNGTVVNDGIAPVYSSSNSIQGGGAAYFNGTFNQQNQNFEGGGGRIDVPINTGPVAMPNMSWGAWVRAALVDNGRYVLSSDQYNGGRGIGVDNRAGDDFAAILRNSDPLVYDTGVAAPINNWIFIGAVYRNNYTSPGVGDLTMYVGNQVFSSISTNINNSSPSFTAIGGSAGGERYWNGYIDNVFIVDGALSQSQMTSIINNPNANLLAIVPEPSSCAMAVAGLACGGFAVGRRRRRA